MLEAEKETLVNQIYDLRLLLKRISEDGDRKAEYIKRKTVSFK